MWNAVQGSVLEAAAMGVGGLAALLANALTFALLCGRLPGDSNLQPVRGCPLNDVIASFAVLVAAGGAFGAQQGWLELVVTDVMAVRAARGAWVVTTSVSHEVAGARA